MKKTFLAILATTAALCAHAATIELLTNGAGTTLEGWTNTYSGSGSAFGIQSIGDVSWFASSYNPCQLSQTVTLSEEAVQTSPIVTASGIVIAADNYNNSGSKICNVKVYEFDAAGNTLATHTIMDRGGELISDPASFSGTFRLNSSTRQLKYELNGQDSLYWGGLYGPKFRNCSLTANSQDIDYSNAYFSKRIELSGETDANLEDGTIYDVNASLTLSADAGYSKFRVLGSNIVAINIKKGVTLTLNGGNATGTTGAGAAISVAPNATLYIIGEGTLIAKGGAAANGANGGNASPGDLDTSRNSGWGGAGGDGGGGGGGGAPAIGGPGGDGGNGGGGGSSTITRKCESDEFTGNGYNGHEGRVGSNGGGMGKVVILGNVTVQATAGAAASSDGSGGSYGSKATDSGSGWSDAYVSAGGGGGGGGARGQNAQYGIGGGGAGGAGGGGGGGGGTTVEDDRYDYSKVAWGQGGAGGNSYLGGTGAAGGSGGSQIGYASYGTAYGGSGGAGGAANTTRGSNGTLQAMSSATLTISPSRSTSQPAAFWGSENVLTASTITFCGDGSDIGTQTASLMFPPPSAPAPADKDGYVFLGYYTAQEGGTQIYDADCNCVYSVWPFVDNMTLYAQWLRLSNLTFISEGNQVGTAIAQQGTTPPDAPEATKTDYRFLGYFTAVTGGTMVYNSDRYPVENIWNSTEDFTLYAQWEPVSVPFTVTLVSDGATVGTVNARQNTSIASVDVPEKEYYAFTGYWTAATGGTKVFNANGTPVEATWTRYEDWTLYAQWDPVSVPFTVTLISDGEIIGTINAQQSYAIQSVTPPTKANSMFTGYWTAETGGVKVFDSDGSPIESTWTRYENWTLYAQWTSAYSVTFVSTDATVGTGVYVDDDTQKTAPVPTRSGDYAFLGYYTEKTGGEKIFDETGALVGSVTDLSPETTLYAQWAVPEGSEAKLVYRGQLNLLTGAPATNNTSYTKKMHFRVYDSSEATTPLWSVNDQVVTVNADGSFVHMFGDDDLSALIATGKVTHIGLAIGDSANLATELKPRRELRPVAAVNRALTAEGAALDIRVGNLVTENALVAADATVSHLEVAGTVNAYGAGKVSVSPLVIGAEERTRLLRGGGVKVFARANPTELTLLSSAQGTVSRGQEIAVAPSDGVALISCKAEGERAFRCPAVVQYCKKDDKVRSPTYVEGGVRVTFFPFVGKEGW